MEWGKALKEKGKRGRGGKKEQSTTLCLHSSDSNIVSQDPIVAFSSKPHHQTVAPHFYQEWHSGQEKWYVCSSICPPYTCAHCNCKHYLWCTPGALFAWVPRIVWPEVGSFGTHIFGCTMLLMESLPHLLPTIYQRAPSVDAMPSWEARP